MDVIAKRQIEPGQSIAAMAGTGEVPVVAVGGAHPSAAGDAASAASHLQRRVAESFGTDAERYDRARPGYPAALVNRIVEVSPGLDVLDAGCGTGICARLFQAAGCRVLGVDPDPRMAELAIRSGVPVDVATLEEWEPAGRMFDAVVAGQAWHWVDPVAGAAKAAAVLRPGGRLTVFWNAFGFPPELRGIFGAIYRRVVPGSPLGGFFERPAVDTYVVMCTRAADGMTASGGFGPPERWRFDWERAYTRAQWLDVVPTLGGQGQLPPAMLEELLAGMGSAIDAAGGSFTMSYVTVAVSAARLGRG